MVHYHLSQMDVGLLIRAFCNTLAELIPLSLECFQQRGFTGNNWSKSSPSRVLAQPLHILLALGCVVLTPTITQSRFSLCSAGVNAVIFHFPKNKGLGWLRVTRKVSSVALTSSLVDVCLQYKPTTRAGTIHHHWRSSAIWNPGKRYLRVLKATAGVN